MPSGPSQYERLGTIHAGLDPLEYIRRELYEIEVTIADLKETGMLRQLTRRRSISSLSRRSG